MLKIVDVKKVLADALIEVSEKKDISKITVNDIVTAANTSRRTFYNHFIDKYDLINYIYKEKIDQIMETYRNDNYQECMRQTYEIFYSNRQFFTKIINMDGQNNFPEFFVNHTIEYFRDYMIRHWGAGTLDQALEYTIRYNAYGQVGVCLDWIRNDMPVPPKQMAEYNIAQIPENLKRYLIRN